MAHYQNGQAAYYGQQSNNPSISSNQPQLPPGHYDLGASQHLSAQQDQHQLRRVPSYDAGDDAGFLDTSRAHNMRVADGNARYAVRGGPYGANEGHGVYNGGSSGSDNLDSRYTQIPAGASPRSMPSRASSQNSTISGYQYQYSSVPIASPTQPAYNPQQYALPHTQSQQHISYNALAYNTGSNGASYSNTTPAHQPYNPAAYQPTSIAGYGSPRRSSVASHYGQTPPTPQSYGFSSQQVPPPPPPRGPDHPYGSRQPSQYVNSSPDPQYAYSSSQIASPTVVPASLAYGASAASRPYSRGSQASGYAPQTPLRADFGSLSSFDEQPPEPPAHYAHGDDSYSKRNPLSRPGSGRSLPTPPIQVNQPQLSPRRTDTLTRHPQLRPLPGPPIEVRVDVPPIAGSNGVGTLRRRPEEELVYDDLMREVEAAVMDARPVATRRHSSRVSHVGHQEPTAEADETAHLTHVRLSPDGRHTHPNGNMATGTGQYVNYDAYSDDSDAEAAAGLAMLQMADEEEKAQAERLRERVRSGTNASIISAYASHTSGEGASPYDDNSSDIDYTGHDLALYGGGYEGHLHYGDEDFSLDQYMDQVADRDRDRIPATSGSLRSSNQSTGGRGNYSDGYDYPAMPHNQYPPDARVDAGGTGGLSEPNAYGRRLSFDYGDEGDGPLAQTPEHDRSGSESPDKGEPDDLFFHPGMRPLPPAPVEPADNATLLPHLMPAGTYRHQEQGDLQEHAQYPHPSYPVSPDSYGPTVPSPSQVPRSTSLSSHPIGPRTDPPIRSKTDADRAKYKLQQEMLRQQQNGALGFDVPSQASDDMTLDLPTIPTGRRKKFNPAKLSSEHFKKCTEPWALSAVVAWIKDLSEDETDLKEQAIVDAIVALFTHKVPTMNIADAETLAARVVKNMLQEEALVKDEEWVKFGAGTLSGVLFQITGTGCYSSKLHVQETEAFGRCYSHHCMRTLKKVNLRAQVMEPQRKAEDWVTFYKVTKEMLESYPKKEIDRQNNLHEIVTTEDAFIGQLDVLRELYRDQLAKMQPPIITPKRLNKFLNDVFGRVDAVKKVNEDFLLAQLKYRQKEQGPFIVGFSDIFREWIRKAKTVYIDYAATFPQANYLVRKEAERNIHFRQFLNQVRDHKLSNRLSWDTFLKAPITRIQRYTLLLATVHKNMLKDSEEKTNLAQAIEEIKLVALDCDNKVGEMSKKASLMELSSKLQLRPEMKKEVELNLEHLGREIIFRGDLQRPGNRTRFNLVDTHAILFDHYLVLAKTFIARDPSRTVKYESYDVSKLPIPMDLLVLESTNDDPVVKSSLAPSNVLESSKDDKILYPFKIKHLGKTGTYTLYAFTAQNRQEWCDKIIEAKTKHAAALFAQNAEPFRLRVLADTAFAYSDQSAGTKSVTIKGTPLDRAIKEVEQRYANSAAPRPPPICRTAVHCATIFQQPPGRMRCAIGTDYGVYVSDYNDPRGWIRAIPIMRVTQIAVFEEFNLFLLIADKSLIAYHLDVACPVSGVPSQGSQDSARRAPQKLSGSREVGFFAAGRMKDRMLVMYKKRDGLSSTFKVMEPVLQKSSTSRTRFFPSRRGQTEFFREFDEFYIPAESYSINLFHSSLAISTQRGIEVLTIDKKQPWSVPNLRSETPEAQAYLTSIAHRIKDLRPLGMFRLSDSEFLVAYEECAVYVNKHGDVSRSVVMEFVGRAHAACLYGKFLILFNEDFVEVRNAMNGRLRQVIPGHNVVCLDDGSSLPGSGANMHTNAGGAVNLASGLAGGTNGVSSTGSTGRTVKLCMQHPELERNQIVLELVENEGQKG